MTTDPRAEKFMSVGLGENGTPISSFEEIRINDYLQSYRSTGRPPQPVPQEPSSAMLRQSQGLPPLFEPFSVSQSQSFGSGTDSNAAGPSTAANNLNLGANATISDPAHLPPAQAFKPMKSLSDPDNSTSGLVTFLSTSALNEYKMFSFEELRYYAYLSGNKQPPNPVPMFPFEQAPVAEASTSSPSGPTGSLLFSNKPALSIATAASSDEQLQSLAAKPDFASHSAEEHRIAYLKFGRPNRDPTSAEINAGQLQQQQPQQASFLGGSSGSTGSSFIAPQQSQPSSLQTPFQFKPAIGAAQGASSSLFQPGGGRTW